MIDIFSFIHRSILQIHIKDCLDRAEGRISWLIELEDLPFSLNTHYLADYKSKFISHYRAAREKYERRDIIQAIEDYNTSRTTSSIPGAILNNKNTSVVQPTGIAKALAGLAEAGLSGVTAQDLPKLLPPDRMEPALHIMADVRAYFQG